MLGFLLYIGFMEKNFKELLNKFNIWYVKDIHSKNVDAYDDTINYNYLSSLNKEKFITFFADFYRLGGKIQSGGSRNLKSFEEEITNTFSNFKNFILEPFSVGFNLESWFNRIKDHNHFGEGIATIYLNRVNRNKYPVINGKSLNSLKLLGHKVSYTKNYKNYKRTKVIQSKLIEDYPIFENYYKIDSFNHYIIGTNEGKEAVKEYLLKKDLLEIQNKSDSKITEKNNLILCRIGQGNFRKDLIKLWKKCSTTGYKEINFLTASHIKPWRNSEPNERLDKFNGFLLTPNLDKAFDNGFISFDESGNIIISKKFKNPEKLGINEQMKIELFEENKPYLKFHRKEILQK